MVFELECNLTTGESKEYVPVTSNVEVIDNVVPVSEEKGRIQERKLRPKMFRLPRRGFRYRALTYFDPPLTHFDPAA